MNSGSYVPRAGTRARAVFDTLQDGQEHRWSELKEDYRLAVHPYSNPNYISLTLGRLLKRIATRVRKGVYVRRLMEKNPCAEIPLPAAPPVPPQTGSPEIEDMAWGSTKLGPDPSCNRSDPEKCVLQEHHHGLDEITELETELHKLTQEIKVKENANLAQGDRIRQLENEQFQLERVADRYQEDNIELRKELEETRALLNKTEVHLIRAGEALEEAKSQHAVMQEQIRARDQVIKNQLGWVERLETKISNARKVLEE